MAVENSDDDISILSHSDLDDIDGELLYERSLPKIALVNGQSPSHQRDRGSEVALRKAYHDLKHRYNNVLTHNQQLTQTVKKMESHRYRANGSFEMEERRMAQGTATQGDDLSSADVMALQGHIKSLERQLMVASVQSQSLQQKCQQLMEELSQEQEKLVQEQHLNDRLKAQLSEYTSRRGNTQEESRSSAQLSELTNQNAQLKQHMDSLRRSHQEVTDRNRQLETENAQLRVMDSALVSSVAEIPSHSSLPATEELAELKLVIAGLKTIVLQQRDFLQSLGLTGKLHPGGRLSGCQQMGKGGNGPVSTLMVDGVDSPGTGPVQVNSRTMLAGGEVRVRPQSAYSSTSQRSGFAPNIPTIVQREGGREDQPQPCGGAQHLNGILSSSSRTEVIHRQPMQKPCNPRQANSDVILRNQRPPQPHSPRSYHNVSESLGTQDTNGSCGSGRVSVQYVNADPAGRQVWSQQDRMSQGGGDGLYPLPGSGWQNQDVRNSQTGDGGLQLSPSASLSGPSSPRQGQVEAPGSGRPRSGSPVDETAQLPNGSPMRTLSGRQCPVCMTDYSHMTMESFQTHVFECFDDNQSPSETIHAGDESASERVCPMCNGMFPSSTVTQEEFEQHVQSHFVEDVTTQFEILRP